MGMSLHYGDVAALPDAEIGRMVANDRKERDAVVARSAEGAPFMVEAVAATRRADQGALRAVLSRALLTMTPAYFIEDLATPYMHELGALWERGELSPGHEHAASEVMRRLIAELLAMLPAAEGASTVVVATISGQRHDIGALFAAAAAALEGWRITFLGADLPADDIGRVAVQTRAAAVALSITIERDNVHEEVARLREAVGEDLPLLVGGRHAAVLANVPQRVTFVRDIATLRSILRTLAPAVDSDSDAAGER